MSQRIDIETLERTYSVVPVPDAESMRRSFDVSPDGQSVCFTWNRSGVFQLWLSSLDGGEPRPLTRGEAIALEPRWTRDGRHVIFLRDRDGDEKYGLWRADVATGDAAPLAIAEGAARRAVELSPDGSRIAFVSDEGGGVFDLWSMAADGSGARRLTHSDDPVMLARWAPAGDLIAIARLAEGGTSLATVDAATGEERRLGSFGGWPSTLAWSPDGATLACNDDVDGGSAVVLLDVASGRTRMLARADSEQEGCAFTPDGRVVAYTLNRDGNFDLVLQDLESGSVRVRNIQDGVHAAPRFTPDGAGIVSIFSSATQPPDLWYVPLDVGQPRPISRSLPADVDGAALTQARVVGYPAPDGATVPALYYGPGAPAASPPPAVVFVHGGPTAQHTNTWYPVVQYIAAHGFAVLAPNYRGSTGYGAAWRDANVRDWGGADLWDVIAGADYLARERLADGNRIAVMGASYGGYLALMALASAPERWGAGISLVGIADLRTLYATTRESDTRPYLEQQIGTPEDNPELYDTRSPIRLVDRIRAPVLLLQGANDPRVPLSEAETMAARLQDAGRTCELKVYPQEGHGFMRTAHRLDSIRTALEFLRRHLG